jgi:hypothetical protein
MRLATATMEPHLFGVRTALKRSPSEGCVCLEVQDSYINLPNLKLEFENVIVRLLSEEC